MTVVLTESTPRSGTFVLEIATVAPLDQHGNLIAADTSAVPPTLPVNLRDAVTMSAADVSDALELESTPPSFSNFNPPHNTAVRDRRPEVSAHVTDRESGLVDRNIHVTFRITEGSRTRTVELTPRYDGDVSPIPGGFEVRQRLPGAHAPAGDATIEWWVSAKDNAGNIGHSSNESSSVLIDSARPSLLRAETGRHWDPGLVTGDSDDKTEYRASRADPTSVLVVFDEHLDGATVTAADFEVDGDRPAAAAVRNVTVRDDSRGGDGNSDIAGDDVLDVGLPRGYVFLTVDEMSPDSRPGVELVGQVSDLAGNGTRTGRNTGAYDRAAPALTVARAGGDTTPAAEGETRPVSAEVHALPAARQSELPLEPPPARPEDAFEAGAVIQMTRPLERPESLHGSTYKIRWPESDHAIYITINDIVRDGRRQPFEIFINSKNTEHYAWTVALTRMISAVFRRGGDVSFIVEELKAVFDPRGGQWMGGHYVPSILAAIGGVIEQHLVSIGALAPPETARLEPPSADDGDAPARVARLCGRCGQPGLLHREGCDLCPSCGYSKCA